MPIEDIYSISQIAAAVAVVITLIFVALQLRQANKTQRTDMHQSAFRRGMDMCQVLCDPAHAPLIAKASRADAELSAEEVWRLYMLTRILALNFQDLEWQRKAGVYEEAELRDAMVGTQFWFALPGVRVCWTMFRTAYLHDTAEMIERMFIRDTPTAPTDFASAWREAARGAQGSVGAR